MEFRVLIAVFVTLFGIAVGMAGGDIQSEEDLLNALQNADFSESGMLSITDLLSVSSSKPANTTIQADLKSGEPMDINVKSPASLTLHLSPGSTIQAGDATFNARAGDEGTAVVTFDGFTGHVKTEDNLSVDGRVRSIDMDAMSLNYSKGKTFTASSGIQQIHLSGLTDQHVSFESAEGLFTTGTINTTLTNQPASLRFFEGELTISPDGDGYHYLFDGKVHKGLLGDGDSRLTIGG